MLTTRLGKEKTLNSLGIEIISKRIYGEPKLPKPKELKNIKQSFSADFIPKKCTCKCFVVGDNLYVQHRDYFSRNFEPQQQDLGMPLGEILKKYFDVDKNVKKFVYPDGWGEVVLRNECWLKITNLKQQFEEEVFFLDIRHRLVELWANLHDMNWYDLDLVWERFFDNVLSEYERKEC